MLLAPLASDIVLTGQDRTEIGLLIVPNREACAEMGFSDMSADGVMTCPAMRAEIGQRLGGRADTGSSTRISRALVLADPPSLAHGEVTAKGNLNYRKILDTRSVQVERLYDPADLI